MPVILTVKKTEGKPGAVYYPLELKEVPQPQAGPGQVLVRMRAVALNHRDLFIRQNQYPGISFDHPLLSDGYGTVEEVGPGCRRAEVATVGAGVILVPCRNWISDPKGPEDAARFATLGGAQLVADGTASEYLAVDEDEVEAAPAHLTPAEAAALPLVGLTAWRALVTKSGAVQTETRTNILGTDVGAVQKETRTNILGTDVGAVQTETRTNILVTGIGGGVALAAAQFALAHGCRVFVTSGDAAKLQRARTELGVTGGVSYRDADWDRQLQAQLPRERPFLDAIIDGAGGDIVKRAVRLLRAGGVIASYGMTVGPRMDWLMSAVMRNQELRGSTMGSRAEFRAMVAFVRAHGIRPVVSRVVHGGLSAATLPALEGLFDEMKAGRQFGKLVLELDGTPPKL